MKSSSLNALALAGLLCAAALPALADSSTGTTNPATQGSGKNLPNGNVDGSAAPTSPGGTTKAIKPQDTGNPEGSTMGGMGGATNPEKNKTDMGDGTGSEGADGSSTK
ncbi:hypothetical protein [Pseudomonas sp. nanlin1]|uniref:hypothetical protein n=1 Tax=Pseudomonas sp. nanlin1 TaxID=3040605 RepID=UPI00389029A4